MGSNHIRSKTHDTDEVVAIEESKNAIDMALPLQMNDGNIIQEV